ncbi:MAG: HdeD family acid-resistance protein [Rhodomicrobium sp.]
MSMFHFASIAENHQATQRSWWTYALLGIALLIGGVIVLGDTVVASLISAIFISWAIVIAGFFQIIHAFSVRHWGGFLLDLLLGLLYIAFGLILLSNPGAAPIKLTLLLGGVLVASGLVRMVLAIWQHAGWGFLLSGILAILAGFLILYRWPSSGLWVLGLFLGVDLVVHGGAWIAYAFAVRSEHSNP